MSWKISMSLFSGGNGSGFCDSLGLFVGGLMKLLTDIMDEIIRRVWVLLL